MEQGHIRTSGGRIFWRQWGNGERLLICLHGFGDTGECFVSLAAALPERFALIAPDMPWHGRTEWEKPSFDAWDVLEIIQAVRRLHGATRCSLLGHSWGARLGLKSLPLLEEDVDVAWMVAPGGFDAGSKWGGERLPGILRRHLIKSVETHAVFWLRFLERLAAWGVVGGAAFRFFQSSLETLSRRTRLFAVWKNLHHFRLRASALSRVGIPIHFLAGESDPLVSLHAVRRFSRKLRGARFIILTGSGHRPDGATIAREILSVDPALFSRAANARR